MSDRVIKLLPFKYIHVLDLNQNVTLLEVGPKTYTCLSDKKVVIGPESMVIIPPNHYCVIENPVVKDEEGKVKIDKYGQALLRHTELEVRLAGEPFPLYPGELMAKNISPLQLVLYNEALHLTAVRDVEITDPQQLCIYNPQKSEEIEMNEPFDKNKNNNNNIIIHNSNNSNNGSTLQPVLKKAGEHWYFMGPGHYVPNVSVKVVSVERHIVIEPGTALRLRATHDLYDHYYHKFRKNGEVWLLDEPGSYLKHVYEEVLSVEKPYLITEKNALHLRALHSFEDIYGIQRKFGEEYLITRELTNSHLVGANEEFVSIDEAVILTSRQYAVIHNPYSEAQSKFLLGQYRTVRGPLIFFLKPPYEAILSIKNANVLGADKAICLLASSPFYDISEPLDANEWNALFDHQDLIQKKKGTFRKAGDEWYVYGPGEFWPHHDTTHYETRAIVYIPGVIRIFSVGKFFLLLFFLFSFIFYMFKNIL